MGLLRDAYDSANLDRAWRWIRSNPDSEYKSYFRSAYTQFALADSALLADLQKRLKRGTYQPSHACKIFYPKRSGILRPYTLLTVEDQIVYQALVNIVAEQLFPHVKARYLTETFGHLYAGKSSVWFYRKWSDGYAAFNKTARQAFNTGLKFTASFDLTAYYDSLAEQKKYELGNSTIFFVLQAQGALVSAESSVVQNAVSYRRNLMNLLVRTGGLLEARGIALQ
jgi:hypothetical protein